MIDERSEAAFQKWLKTPMGHEWNVYGSTQSLRVAFLAGRESMEDEALKAILAVAETAVTLTPLGK